MNQLVPSLELNHRSARELYEPMGQSAGIHVKFDPAGVDSPSSECLDCIWGTLRASLLEGALDAVATVTHTSGQAVSSDTIYVTLRAALSRNATRRATRRLPPTTPLGFHPMPR